jgi:GTPase SAR1 family protein
VTLPVLKTAVVGHTNTGKTSLLRTLTRDSSFGEVSNRHATTRHVEGTALLVEGVPLIELYDTPGLEDSMGLLEHLDSLKNDRHTPWIEVLHQFLESPTAQGEFEQEAKALRQVLASDMALYVVDARDRVLGKHRDELEILGRSATPVVPVLNFVVSAEARTEEWREHLSRVNMHAVVEFDTVVFNELGERRLFEKMQILSDRFHDTLEAVIQDRIRQRANLIRASADLVADLLIDAAAYKITLPADAQMSSKAMASLKQAVSKREQQCVDELLELFRFQAADYESEILPIEEGRWGLDLFSPASLKQFGIKAGGGAAAGGMAGLAVDAMTGGLSLGAAAALGAALGALLSGSQSHGRRLADRLRGFTELRVNDTTLRLLAVRQIDLVQALLRRGHASQEKIRLSAKTAAGKKLWTSQKLPHVLEQAQFNPQWSRLRSPNPAALDLNSGRLAAKEELAGIMEANLVESMGDSALAAKGRPLSPQYSSSA